MVLSSEYHPCMARRVVPLAVHGVVADEELLPRHAEGDDREVDDEAGDGEVPANDEEAAGDLLEELHPAEAAVDGAAGVGDGPERKRVAAPCCRLRSPSRSPPTLAPTLIMTTNTNHFIH